MEAQNNCTNEQAIGALVVGESRRDLYPDPFSMCPKKRLRPQRLSLLIGTGYRKKRAPGRLAFPREVEEVSSLHHPGQKMHGSVDSESTYANTIRASVCGAN